MKIIGTIFLFLLSVLSYSQTNQDQVNTLLDNWHKAAAEADEDLFFSSMTKDARYIGTDAAENWERDELKEWAKKFFDRDSAWDFKKIERNIYFSEDQKLAWFDETLDTWMGVCRGSGVLVATKEGWKIKQYVLSVAVPNDKIDAYLELK